MTNAIFQTTGDALFVSFLIMSIEPRQDSPLRKALIRFMQELDNPTKGQRQWLEQLIGERSGNVNFAGLSPDEVRGQCAMVTQTVKDHLPAPEMHVIHARYIPTEEEEIGRDADGKPIKRFYFSQERVDAVIWLASWLMPNLSSFARLSQSATEMLVAKAFAEHSKTAISFRDLAHSFGGDKMMYQRAFKVIKEHLKRLELMAMGRLTPYFEDTFLVERADEPQAA